MIARSIGLCLGGVGRGGDAIHPKAL